MPLSVGDMVTIEDKLAYVVTNHNPPFVVYRDKIHAYSRVSGGTPITRCTSVTRLEVGAYVIANGNQDGRVLRNQYGRIIFVSDGIRAEPFLVEFEKRRPDFHSGGGRGRIEHCLWCSPWIIASFLPPGADPHCPKIKQP